LVYKPPMVFASSGSLLADRRYAYAAAAAADGDSAAAIDLFGQAIELAPDWAAAWFALGCALSRLAHHAPDAGALQRQAIGAFAKVLTLDPADCMGAGVRLAQLEQRHSDGAMSAAHLTALFDQYASGFDEHVVKALDYRGPALLRQATESVCAGRQRPWRFHRMLDLGCGTGLAAAPFRGAVGCMVGVDLSAAMIEIARQKAIYDCLVEGNLAAFLSSEEPASADLIIAADVFVYVGELASVFAAAARILIAGGLFAFSVQSREGEGFVLGEDLRYAHSAGYLAATASMSGLEVMHLAAASTRKDRGVDVPGLVAVLAKPGRVE